MVKQIDHTHCCIIQSRGFLFHFFPKMFWIFFLVHFPFNKRPDLEIGFYMPQDAKQNMFPGIIICKTGGKTLPYLHNRLLKTNTSYHQIILYYYNDSDNNNILWSRLTNIQPVLDLLVTAGINLLFQIRKILFLICMLYSIIN